ncbi:MAG: MoxR family ATPase [Lachnospiraceae bacterium]|nr:MoxR family ATPase [Lachnospiraceae bacterium]
MGELYLDALRVIKEVNKAIVGKEDAVKIIMATIISEGHILIEDTPGVGKTTMAKAFSKVMGIHEKRVQFTPDVMPADLTGFSIYNKETNKFSYKKGALMCNLFLADEINRTSPKTQSALLEAMEEKNVTVDGVTRDLSKPFVVIATENPEGSVGTQLLPESQLDRFMVCVNMGFPTVAEEIEIIKRRQEGDPVEKLQVLFAGEGREIVEMQKEAASVFMNDKILRYIAELSKASRENTSFATGISPRGSVSIAALARSWAWLDGRDYVNADDIKAIFPYVASHRVSLSTKAKVAHINKEDVLKAILDDVDAPSIRGL